MPLDYNSKLGKGNLSCLFAATPSGPIFALKGLKKL